MLMTSGMLGFMGRFSLMIARTSRSMSGPRARGHRRPPGESLVRSARGPRYAWAFSPAAMTGAYLLLDMPVRTGLTKVSTASSRRKSPMPRPRCPRVRRHALLSCAAATAALLCARPALAVDPAQPLDELEHTVFTPRE